MNKPKIISAINETMQSQHFSGAFYVDTDGSELGGVQGYSNKAEKVDNRLDTKFSIASGSKIFTSVATCKLIEEGKIDFHSTIQDCLEISLPNIDQQITVHQLLTHTSGVPDYFDEEIMDDYEKLWETTPMYQVKKTEDFVPLFQHENMQTEKRGVFHYNNTGYILLGLIIEQISGMSFTDFIDRNIFQKANMSNTGYFSMDALPERTALGYIEEPDHTWRTNIYSVPIKGGPDGGAYTTAQDMTLFWQALRNNELLSASMTKEIVKPREFVTEDIYYGYCGYMEMNKEKIVKYIQMGYDPGVNYRAVHYPEFNVTITVCSNESEGAYELLKELEYYLGRPSKN